MGRRHRRRTYSYPLEPKGGQELTHMLSTRLDYRMYMRSPFPFDRRQLFETLVPDSVLKAARMIETHPFHERLNKGSSFEIKGGRLEFEIGLPQSTFLLSTEAYDGNEYKFSLLDDDTQKLLLKWGKLRRGLIDENDMFRTRLRSLFDAASTWGMFVRVWPDFRALLVETEHAKHFFAEAKAQSRLPDAFNPKYADVWNESKQWDVEFMNTILAELLLFGDPDHDPDDGVAVVEKS